jgi:hypothetical protein
MAFSVVARRIVGLVVAVAGVLSAASVALVASEGEEAKYALGAAILGCMVFASVGLAGFLFARE